MISLLVVNSNPEVQKQTVIDKLDQMKLSPESPNVFWLETIKDSLSIKDITRLKSHFLLKSWSSLPQVAIIVSAEKLTSDAQNALLKTLEEPPANAQLILTTNSLDSLLPTILSRCQIEVIASQQSNNLTIQQSQAIQKFLDLGLADKFSAIEKTEDKLKLLIDLENYFSQQLKHDPQVVSTLKDILKAKEWAEQNGNSRAILEWLMLGI